MNMEYGYVVDEDSQVFQDSQEISEKPSKENFRHLSITKKNSDRLALSLSLQELEKPAKAAPSSTTNIEVKTKQEESKRNSEKIDLKSVEKPLEQQPELNSVPNPDPASKQEFDAKSSARNTFCSDLYEINDDKIKNTFSTTYENRPSQYEENPKLCNSLVLMRKSDLVKARSKEYKPQKSCVKCLIF